MGGQLDCTETWLLNQHLPNKVLEQNAEDFDSPCSKETRIHKQSKNGLLSANIGEVKTAPTQFSRCLGHEASGHFFLLFQHNPLARSVRSALCHYLPGHNIYPVTRGLTRCNLRRSVFPQD